MAKAKKTTGANKKAAEVDAPATPAGTFEAKQAFNQWLGDEKVAFAVGDDVSHLPSKKIQEYMEAGLVQKTEKTAAEQAKDAEAAAHAKANPASAAMPVSKQATDAEAAAHKKGK